MPNPAETLREKLLKDIEGNFQAIKAEYDKAKAEYSRNCDIVKSLAPHVLEFILKNARTIQNSNQNTIEKPEIREVIKRFSLRHHVKDFILKQAGDFSAHDVWNDARQRFPTINTKAIGNVLFNFKAQGFIELLKRGGRHYPSIYRRKDIKLIVGG